MKMHTTTQIHSIFALVSEGEEACFLIVFRLGILELELPMRNGLEKLLYIPLAKLFLRRLQLMLPLALYFPLRNRREKVV